MSGFNDVLKELERELIGFVKRSWQDYRDEAISDAKEFIESSKEALERWTSSLARGAMNREDFEWLIVGQKELAELKALTHKGLTKIKLDRFLNGLIDTIISTIFKLIPTL